MHGALAHSKRDTRRTALSDCRADNPWPRAILRGCLLGLGLAFATEAFRVLVGSNLHVLVPAKAYRSAQLSGNELEGIIRAYGIRTVINLRGYSDPWPWYVDECRVTHRLHVSQEDL